MEVALKKESKGFPKKDIKYELSALLDADSFFYGLFDYGAALVYSNNIASIHNLANESWRKDVFLRKTKIGLLNNLVAIIPESEFQTSDISSIIVSTCGLDDTSQYILRSDRSEKHHLRICYAVPKELVKTMTNSLDGPILYHYVSAFLDSLKDVTNDGLYIDYSGSTLIILALKEGNLILVNTYKVDQDLDAFYWISLAHQTVFGEDKSATIFYSGKLISSTSLLDNLKTYFPQTTKLIQTIAIDGDSIGGEEAFYPLHCISEM